MLGLASIFNRTCDRSFGIFGFWIFSTESKYLGLEAGLSTRGAFATILLGNFAIISFPIFTSIILSSLTLPITENGTLNFSHIFFRDFIFTLSVITSILS